MVATICIVPNCPGNYTNLYKIPKDRKFEKRICKWLSVIGNEALLHLPENKLLQRAVCNVHFEDKYFFRRGLSRSAVPSLYLPDPIQVPWDHFSYVEAEGDETHGSSGSRDINEPSTSENTHGFSESGAINEPSTSENTHGFRGSRDINEPSTSGNTHGFRRSRDINEPSTSENDHIIEGVQMQINVKCLREENKGRAVSTKIHPPFVIHLSNANKKYYQAILDMQRKLKQCNVQKQNYKKRLQIADSFINNSFWKLVPEHIKNLFVCYQRNMNKNQSKRSFTLKEKIVALSIWKKSPKNYRFFQDLFLLPSTVTLKKLITQLDIKPGICSSVFEAMSKNIKLFTTKEKYCVLIFGEMKLSAGINYNSTIDNVEGMYIDKQGGLQYADHATVWMLKGIYGARPWKQPVAFTFCNSSTTYSDIANMFKDVVKAAEDIGLQVIACVCDQNANNVKAISELVKTTSNGTISLNNKEIIPLYDVPHLMKCIRNNLLSKNLEFSLDGVNCLTAKWEHIDGTYEIDRANGPNRLLVKITDQHIKKESIKKMKVAYCTQIFSQTFSKIIYIYCNYKPIQGNHSVVLSPDPMHTAHLLRFFNQLFDSLNNFYNYSSDSNTYFRNINIWNEGIRIITSMRFIKRNPKDKMYPIVLKNWIFTLKNIIKLNNKLKCLNINFAGRNLNQDAVENFFSLVRSHGGRNANPTCSLFTHYYKSIFINNFGKRISCKGNCEDDRSDYFIHTKHIINMTQQQDVEAYHSFTNVDIVGFNEIRDVRVKDILVAVAKNMKTGKCETCKALLKLSELEKLFDTSLVIDICHSIIINNICESHLSQKALKYLEENIIFSTNHTEHTDALKYTIFYNIFHHILNTYIKHVNQILSRKLKNVQKSNIPMFDIASDYIKHCKLK